jgi:hypothetical protein
MPGPGAADRPVILDAYEEHSAGPVSQTHYRLDEVAVVQPFPLLALELDLIGLPASDPLRDTRRQVRCLVRRRLHAQLLIREVMRQHRKSSAEHV